MNTLTEVEAVLETLPRGDLEQLHARLTEQLAREEASAATKRERWRENFEALTNSLALDEAKAQSWMDAVRDARR